MTDREEVQLDKVARIRDLLMEKWPIKQASWYVRKDGPSILCSSSMLVYDALKKPYDIVYFSIRVWPSGPKNFNIEFPDKRNDDLAMEHEAVSKIREYAREVFTEEKETRDTPIRIVIVPELYLDGVKFCELGPIRVGVESEEELHVGIHLPGAAVNLESLVKVDGVCLHP